MGKIIILALILLFPLHSMDHSDKYKHAAVGVAIYVACVATKEVIEYYRYETPLSYGGCLIPVVSAGIGKEVYDYYNMDVHTPDILDAAATIGIPLLFTVTIYTW